LTAESSSSPRFYTWQPPGKPVLVYLSYDVIERIWEEAVRGLGAIPRRGAEVGGILLGSAQRGDKAVVKIVNFLPLPCGHCFGPSYVLSQEEKAAFQQVLAKWRPLPSRTIYAVGYYRSHTRENLFLSDEDVWLLSTYFPDPSHVALLVRPRVVGASVGAFFFWEEGKIRTGSSYLEFPFDRQALGGGEPGAQPGQEVPIPVSEPEPESVSQVEAPPKTSQPPAEPEPETPPAAVAPAPAEVPLPSFLAAVEAEPKRGVLPGWKSLLIWIPVFITLVLVGGWLGTQGAGYLGLAAGLAARSDPYSLKLKVTEYGDNLHLTWDRDLLAIRESERGILIIGDGDQTRAMDLDASQLRTGSVIYRRLSSPVRFRLEVFLSGNRTLSESWEPPAPPEKAATPQPAQ
jgi:proteasome lid subunit RPN8/RPN11